MQGPYIYPLKRPLLHVGLRSRCPQFYACTGALPALCLLLNSTHYENTPLSLLLAVLLVASCKKDNTAVQVRFVTTGTEVTQFKFTTGATEVSKDVPYSGSRDTTVTVSKGTLVKLDSKASSNNLSGAIFVDGRQVATQTDTDPDGDGKSQVKVDYSIPK